MAEVQPFRGWRYDMSQVGDLSEVTAPPYDVIGPEQQDALYKQHPCNVVRLILNRPEPGDAGPNDRYARAASFLRNWLEEGVLMRERESAYYVYHQVFEWEGTRYERKGFLGRVRLEELGKGAVFPHEQTLSGPKADRLALTKACKVNLSPIFGLYPEDTAQQVLEKAIVGKTALEATDPLGVIHRLWPVTNFDAISAASAALREQPIFIADGHHRYETALNYRNELEEAGQLGGTEASANFVLMMLVCMEDPGLQVLPTHRLVSGIPDLTAETVRNALSGHFSLETIGTGPEAARLAWEHLEMDGSQDVLAIGTSDGIWTVATLTDGSPLVTLAPDHSPAWRALGVSILHQFVLGHLLLSALDGKQPEIRYVHQVEEVQEAQAAGSCQMACLVPPARIDDVQEIAANLEKMPPKSTYFYPKLLSGLVFHSLE